MSARRARTLTWLVAILALLLLSLPYLYAWAAAGEGRVFGGFLLNPVDGNSYLAKMRQGLNGAWSFTLPYTAQPGEGAALNLYYLFLGHIARWTGAALLLVFHAARLLGAALMLLALYRFFERIFASPASRLAAFSLAALGSGLGWLALLAGALTPDFWLAEAYPFLAAFANPHFPLGIALQLYLLTPLLSTRLASPPLLSFFLGAALLSVIYPFGLVVAGAVLAAALAWRLLRRLPLGAELGRLAAVGLGGLPYAAYALWVVNQHPQLAAWNAQNLTPAPAPGALLVALSPALLLAAYGAYLAYRQGQMDQQMLVVWVVASLVLIYLPFNLQRRLISAIYVPLAGLALVGLEGLTRGWRRWGWLAPALLMLALPTNLIILASGLGAAAGHNPDLYLSAEEWAAYDWLDANATADALVLAGPQTGNRLPAYADVSVLYGHPFETVEVEAQRQLVEDFYLGGLDEDWLAQSEVDLVFYGPREQALGVLPDLPGWHIVHQRGDIQIWGPLD